MRSALCGAALRIGTLLAYAVVGLPIAAAALAWLAAAHAQAQTLPLTVVTKTSNYSLITGDAANWLGAAGASSAVTFTMPNPGAAANNTYQFFDQTGFGFVLTTAGGTAKLVGAFAGGPQVSQSLPANAVVVCDDATTQYVCQVTSPPVAAILNGTGCALGSGLGCALPAATQVQSGAVQCGPGLACRNGAAYVNETRSAISTIVSPAYYVSPSGSDSNAGTFVAPFLTLGKCQTAMQGGATKVCYVEAGTYTLPATGMTFTSSDNGETWSYYPPDGPNRAVLNLGSLNPSTHGWYANGPSNFSLIGFYFINDVQHYFMTAWGSCTNCQILDNIFDQAGANTGYVLEFGGANTNLLVAGNTISNIGGANQSAIYISNGAVTQSVFRDNVIQCVSGFGVNMTGGNGNIFARNYITGIGQLGGAAPLCGSNVNSSGTGISDGTPTGQNLFILNTILNTQGYNIVVSAGAGTTQGTGEIVSDNYLDIISDPSITFNGNSGGVLRRNVINANPGSGGADMGNEQDDCPMTYHSDNLLIANNVMNAQYAPLSFGASQNSFVWGNIGNIGTVSTPPPGRTIAYPAGVSIQNRSRDYAKTTTGTVSNGSNQITSIASTTGIAQGVGQVVSGTGIPSNTTVTTLSGSTVTMSNNATGGTAGENVTFSTCGTGGALLEDSTGNTIEDNQFTSSASGAKYGIYIEPSQTGQTIEYNILYPFGSPGTAAIQDNSGGSNTISNNQTTSGNAANLATAPPIADAGAAQLIAPGQTVYLNGQARAMPGAALVGTTYTWTQVAGTSVTIANPNSAQAAFVAPAASQAAILGFKLTVTNANGSTYDEVFFGEDPSL